MTTNKAFKIPATVPWRLSVAKLELDDFSASAIAFAPITEIVFPIYSKSQWEEMGRAVRGFGRTKFRIMILE